MSANLPPLALYLHLPWCVKKCPYCDFNSFTAGGTLPRRRYVEALIQDLDKEAERAAGRPLVSVFFGGGTPSLFPPEDIARLLDVIYDRFAAVADPEITLEANPGTVESGAPAGYRRAGVNRLSLGAQSFDDAALAALGRIHRADDVRRSFAAARDAGFDNINLDLMYALPGQDPAGAYADLEAALALGPEHLSWYHLTLEPNTVFYARPPAGLPDDDTAAEIQRRGESLLAERGYEQYETSAYARDRRYCRHNLNYWSFGDYLGIGAGAHGKLTNGEGVFRYAKPANPQSYMAAMESGAEPAPLCRVNAADRSFEFMLNALRLTGGFGAAQYTARTGLPAAPLEIRLEALMRRGLVEPAGIRRWRPTALGRRFLNELQAEFLP